MVRRFALVIAILTAALQSHVARAQTVPCPACRANVLLPTCDEAAVANPPREAIGLVGTVVDTDTSTACGRALRVDVIRSSQASLPQRIAIDLGPCVFWSGKPGGTIRVMVDARPSEDGFYRLRACK
jgi:hypothetical protein